MGDNFKIKASGDLNSVIATRRSKATARQKIGAKPEFLTELTKEINEAKNQIASISELEKGQRAALMQLLDDVKVAVENNNENAREKCKSTLESFKKFAGDVAFKVLPVIVNLTKLAQFFEM